MSIDFELRLWDASKADERWLSWLDLSPDERAESEPQELVESVLEIMDQTDAPAEWRTGRFAMLDLAFGQVGKPFPVRDIMSFEPFARLLLISFAGCAPENGELPSYRLLFHPQYYERLLEVVNEEAIRTLFSPELFTEDKLSGLRRILEPLEVPQDAAFADKLTESLLAFWKQLEPFLRQAVALDAGKGNVVILEVVNDEVNNLLLQNRATQHEQWLRSASE